MNIKCRYRLNGDRDWAYGVIIGFVATAKRPCAIVSDSDTGVCVAVPVTPGCLVTTDTNLRYKVSFPGDSNA